MKKSLNREIDVINTNKMIRKITLIDIFKIYNYYKKNYKTMELFPLFIPYYLINKMDIYAYFNNKKIVGIVYLIKKGKSKNSTYNLGLFVTKEYRGRGIGTELIEKVCEKGYKKILLGVREDNVNAMKIYKKAGFKLKFKKIIMERDSE